MIKKSVSTIIIDMDNTIFDWFKYWSTAFIPMYRDIIDYLKLYSNHHDDDVYKQIKVIHEKFRTPEYPLIIEEINGINEKFQKDEIYKKFSKQIENFKARSNETLILYENVFNTLVALKKKGVKIIMYSDSQYFYCKHRIKKFGLDGVIDVICCPEGHDIHENNPRMKFVFEEKEIERLEYTSVLFTPEKALKPNISVLNKIINEFNIDINSSIYIGDSKIKDISAAQKIGLIDVYAKYGHKEECNEFKILDKVSHFDDRYDRKIKLIKNIMNVKPSYVLENNLSEIFSYFSFEGSGPPSPMVDDRRPIF